ncbi:MAG: hypothetical protein ABSA03_07970 [Streptosporangiaceae bacterium]
MTSADLLTEAVAELYSCDPGEFVERRGVLAARARAAGDAPAAKRIAGLRKPTRSAWVLNQLARSAPDAATEVAGLGEELRAAQRSLDGAALRELSLRRRQLIDALARQAFTVSGEDAPSPALRDEVTATLGAALADPQVAELLQAGALERAAHRDGFGPEPAVPALALLPSSPGRARAPAPKRPVAAPARAAAQNAAAAPARAAAKGAAADPARAAATVTALADVRDKAERERRGQAIAAAEQAAAEADEAADAADRAEREQESAVRVIEAQLTQARERLAGARVQARRARAGQRRAGQALDRLREHPP